MRHAFLFAAASAVPLHACASSDNRVETACTSNSECAETELCATNFCGGIGLCVTRETMCDDTDVDLACGCDGLTCTPEGPVVGCDGLRYAEACEAAANGVRVRPEN
jgi:hypothetical protein